jgi:uncharacterized protein with PIN domain
LVTVRLRFYEELNDFLPPSRRRQVFLHHVPGRSSVKDVIESVGVPHVEVDLILVDGRSVGFDHIVAEGERISVYPVFESIDIRDAQRLRPRPLRVTRFVCDVHLGRLARRLRLLGFDTLYDNTLDDPALARLSQNEDRVLLTRDQGLLKRTAVTRGTWIRETNPKAQVREVVDRLQLRSSIQPFGRCLRCNGKLRQVPKRMIAERLAPRTRESYEEFWQCESCEHVYWKGSHFDRMSSWVRDLLEPESPDSG